MPSTVTVMLTELTKTTPDRIRCRTADGGSTVGNANAARNARRNWARYIRWRPARAALWTLLDEHLPVSAAVAVVGAGNGDDLPLRRMARRASRVDLIDLDPQALRQARRRWAFAGATVDTVVEDVTDGAADLVVCDALGDPVSISMPLPSPVGKPPYDVVVADLFLSQLLYPALMDSRLPAELIDETLLRHGQRLTDAVVARLHASAPGGLVVFVHDMLGWWAGHPQPFSLDEVLDRAARGDPERAVAFATGGTLPYGCDPRTATARAGGEIIDTKLWRWPFAPGTDYLVCATVAQSPPRHSSWVQAGRRPPARLALRGVRHVRA